VATRIFIVLDGILGAWQRQCVFGFRKTYLTKPTEHQS